MRCRAMRPEGAAAAEGDAQRASASWTAFPECTQRPGELCNCVLRRFCPGFCNSRARFDRCIDQYAVRPGTHNNFLKYIIEYSGDPKTKKPAGPDTATTAGGRQRRDPGETAGRGKGRQSPQARLRSQALHPSRAIPPAWLRLPRLPLCRPKPCNIPSKADLEPQPRSWSSTSRSCFSRALTHAKVICCALWLYHGARHSRKACAVVLIPRSVFLERPPAAPRSA